VSRGTGKGVGLAERGKGQCEKNTNNRTCLPPGGGGGGGGGKSLLVVDSQECEDGQIGEKMGGRKGCHQWKEERGQGKRRGRP